MVDWELVDWESFQQAAVSRRGEIGKLVDWELVDWESFQEAAVSG